jgi:hypothetical protein
MVDQPMIRIPIPIALAVVVVLGAATIYFYVTVISNPTYGAWSDQGTTTTYQYTVPAGQWVILGTFGGSSITVSSNVSINLRADAFTVQAWSNTFLPSGTWALPPSGSALGAPYFGITISSTGAISLNNLFYGTCSSGSYIKLSNGMVMYYPNYTASGATCSNQMPINGATITSSGTLNVFGGSYPTSMFGISVDGVTSYTINPHVYSGSFVQKNVVYYVYFRPVYTIWVSPSANATITVSVSP